MSFHTNKLQEVIFMINYQKILEMHLQGISQRTISSSTGHSRDKIREVVNEAKARGLEVPTEEMTNPWLENHLFPEKSSNHRGYHDPNWDYVHKELLKKNVTLKLLHKEYEHEAKVQNKVPYAYRTFCEKYGDYGNKYKLTMPIHRKPGEILEVDWAGSTLSVKNSEDGQDHKVYIFVASWPFSQHSYAEGFYDMKTDNWLTAHVHALEYFQGVPETVVSDNLKTGVIKTDYSEPLLNEGYRQLSDYYRFTIVPARVRAPKDKSSVEGNVGFISRQVIAALRNEVFFSLNELNQAIYEKTQKLNQESFQKRPGSRYSVFQEEELSFLGSLRQPRFTQSQWRISKVQLDYHIQIKRMFYSVPYEYVNDEVEVRITDHLIEVYFNEHRIASHKRLRGDIGQYSTNIDHMPDNHRHYLNHTPKENLLWAKEVGPNVYRYVESILAGNSEKKALKLLSTLRNIASKSSPEELEVACHTLMSVAKEPTNSLLKSILSRAKKRKSTINNQMTNKKLKQHTDNEHGFVRGANYFGGKNHEK